MTRPVSPRVAPRPSSCAVPPAAGSPRRLLAALLGAWLVLVAALPAAATTAVQLDDRQLVERSQLIVAGRCVGTETVRLDRRLVTLARFQVAEVLKGAPPEGDPAVARYPVEVTVVLPGGGEPHAPFPVAEVWPGAPTLMDGEEALLFLRPFRSLADGWAVVGFSQGKFGVVRSPGTAGTAGAARAVRDLSGTTLRTGDGALDAGGERSEPLDDLVRRVRSLVAEEFQ